MDKALLDAFRDTDYLVCLDEVEWASIRIGEALPPSLQARVGTRTWGFITAWNPGAEARTATENLAAQRKLLEALHARSEAVLQAIGVGHDGWSEPSLFAIGPDLATLDALAMQHGQLAYVHGHADNVASLRTLE